MSLNPIAVLRETDTVTILNGGSLSSAFDLVGHVLTGIQMPAAWTTANLTFQASSDNSTFADLYDENGVEVNIPAAASRYIKVDPLVFAGIRFIKVRSGTTGAAVNQAADRVLTLNTRHFA